MIVIVNVNTELAEKAVITYTLRPVPNKGRETIRTLGRTYTFLVRLVLNIPSHLLSLLYTSCHPHISLSYISLPHYTPADIHGY